jgi:hypothetical protein
MASVWCVNARGKHLAREARQKVVLAQAQALSSLASQGFYQASSKQVRTFETFVVAEHFFPWIMLQFERGNDGTCDRNAQEIDFYPRLCRHGPRKTTCDCAKGRESVPNEKRSFSQNRRLAAEAGRKGGQSVNPTKRSFSRNHAPSGFSAVLADHRGE